MSAIMILSAAIFAVAAMIFLVLAIKKWCKCKAMEGLIRKLQNMLMFNSILRYFMMTFLSISVGCAR